MKIGELIQRAIDQGNTYRSLAERSAAGGHPVAHQTFQTLGAGRIRAFPDVATIRGLAYTLRLSEATVIRSIAETLGLRMEPPGTIDIAEVLIPSGADRLTDRQITALRALIVSIVSHDQGDGAGDP